MFLTAPLSYAAVGFPHDRGEKLLATENSQRVTWYGVHVDAVATNQASVVGGERPWRARLGCSAPYWRCAT